MDLFGTAGIRGRVGDRVTVELALAVGRAIATDGGSVVVGRDGRETGAALADAVAAGIESGGGDVVRLGRVPTPTLAFASRRRRGVMVTASHNPPGDNGLKLFVDGREYDEAAERRVESRVRESPPPSSWSDWGRSWDAPVLEDYRDAVVDYARNHGSDLDGLRLVVDCGNGMASLVTPWVCWTLGARVVALNANVDGHFPGRASKPTPESLRDLRAFVADGDFDLGIAHDGDADRIVVVDRDGEVVHEDTVLAILAEHYTATSDAVDPVVVTTPNASARIDERVGAAGGRVDRVRLGALHEGIASVRAAGDPDTEVVFAAEPWKHVHPPFGGWIDGVVSAAVFLRLVAEAGDIAELREPVTERPYRKVNVDCPDGLKETVLTTLVVTLPAAFPDANADSTYGIRLAFSDDSWVLVRPSGTEPYVRIYAESVEVDRLVEEVVAVVEAAIADRSEA